MVEEDEEGRKFGLAIALQSVAIVSSSRLKENSLLPAPFCYYYLFKYLYSSGVWSVGAQIGPEPAFEYALGYHQDIGQVV